MDKETVHICHHLTIGGTEYAQGDTVTVGAVTFIVDSSVFGQEPAPWTGEYTISASVVADDEAIAEAVTVTVPDTAAYGEEFSIQIEAPEGYGVVYVSTCGTIFGADTDVLCTGSTKYSDSEDYLYCIVPAELDGMPVSGFGSGTDNVIYRSSLYAICFQEGIETFAYQALYDLNSCQIGILPASALSIDEGFVRSMPVVTWGINAACDAAQEFVDASLYSYEYINTWDEANIAALTAADTISSASGEASSEASGEASGEM